MTYIERTKAFCASILLILKNATIVIPVLEGIIYSIVDLVKVQKKVKSDSTKVYETFEGHDGSYVPDSLKKD